MAYEIDKAKEAIREKQLNDIVASIRLKTHKKCVSGALEYGLPYRVLWDYYQNDRDFMEIPINPFYPLPRVPKEGELTATERENKVRLRYSYDEWQQAVTDESILREYQAEEQRIHEYGLKKARRFKIWNLDTFEGVTAWKWLFTRFLVPYKNNIHTWSKFDFWGDTEHSDEETEELKEYYLDLIADFETDPEYYDKAPRYKQLNDYELYNLRGNGLKGIEGESYPFGYMWNGLNDEAPDHAQALQIMYKEREQELNAPVRNGTLLHSIENIINDLERIADKP